MNWAAAFTDARERTRLLTCDLDTEERRLGPILPIVNPPLWELGHVAWFQERWVLRHRRGRPPRRPDADGLFGSTAIPHGHRWTVPLPSYPGGQACLAEVLADLLSGLPAAEDNEAGSERYFLELVLLHEDMHAEAFWYTRQTLGYSEPGLGSARTDSAQESATEAMSLPGGRVRLGADATPSTGQASRFVFDNEKWGKIVQVAPFRLSREPASETQYAEFVLAQGYRRPEWWSPRGREWREKAHLERPAHWQRAQGGDLLVRNFDQLRPLRPGHPMFGISAYEAGAYARFRGGRLPTEAEWEYCATTSEKTDRAGLLVKRAYPWGDSPPTAVQACLDGQYRAPTSGGAVHAGESVHGLRQLIGSVWEWTQSEFMPFPGFTPDPYEQYSEPWFGSHRVLRGGSFASHSRFVHGGFRNFYRPGRNDLFAGVRVAFDA